MVAANSGQRESPAVSSMRNTSPVRNASTQGAFAGRVVRLIDFGRLGVGEHGRGETALAHGGHSRHVTALELLVGEGGNPIE